MRGHSSVCRHSPLRTGPLSSGDMDSMERHRSTDMHQQNIVLRTEQGPRERASRMLGARSG